MNAIRKGTLAMPFTGHPTGCCFAPARGKARSQTGSSSFDSKPRRDCMAPSDTGDAAWPKLSPLAARRSRRARAVAQCGGRLPRRAVSHARESQEAAALSS